MHEDGSQLFQLMSVYKLKNKIALMFKEQKDSLIQKIQEVRYVCTTADIWSTKKRSFMGTTVHWIDEDTLKPKSQAMSCEHFFSPHDNERIAEHLQVIHSIFGLDNKIVATVTDSAASIGKAFRDFGLQFESNQNDDEQSQEERDEIVPIDIEIGLPRHIRCASHVFNRISTHDAAEALTLNKYFNVHSSAFKKLNKLWNCTNRPKTAEKIKSILGSSLYRPVETRWNSIYDSVSDIVSKLSKNTSKFDELVAELEIPPLTDTDKKFLNEYVKVLHPIARALDYLQANDCLFASFIPIVYSTKDELLEMKLPKEDKDKIEHCLPLLNAVLKGFDKRFGYLYEFGNTECVPALIATITHPYFKLRWMKRHMKTDENLEAINKILFNAVKDCDVKTTGCCEVSKDSFGMYE